MAVITFGTQVCADLDAGSRREWFLADGTVEIHAHADSRTIELSVTDGCGGIPDGDLDRVFDVAWRGSHARTPGADIGAGLGLAIVKGIVEAHRGTVAVSNHAPGCRFIVRIPA